MRTHLLSKLDIEGKQKALELVSEIDFYKITKVERLCFIDDSDEFDGTQYPKLHMVADFKDAESALALEFLFEDVRDVVIPEIQQSLFLTELEFEDIRDRMLDGLKFEVVDQYDKSFRFYCGNIILKSCELRG
jgi:hypothetical protein